jgi:hypothetical protein
MRGIWTRSDIYVFKNARILSVEHTVVAKAKNDFS